MSIKFLESSVYRSDRDLTWEEYIADSPNCMNIDGSDLFSFNGHKLKENLAIIHHSHMLKLAFLSEITIFTGEARQSVRSDCAVSLSKPQIWRTNVR